MRLRRMLPLCLSLLLLLSACGPKAAEVTPTPTPTPPVRTQPPAPTETAEPEYAGPRNPLTGEPMDALWVNKRPVAIMLNNLVEALPQQGQSEADIIYECLEEGGITRMMAVYQDPREAGVIGSVRSTRTYYLELALGHDAILIHAGGSDVSGVEDAYGMISAWGVTALDGVRGPYMSNTVEGNLMWRDPDRVKSNGYVHSVVTTGEKIEEIFAAASFRQDHEEGWSYQMDFADDGTPTGGSDAPVITVPFSYYKTGVFTYDPETERYLVSQYGEAYVDGNTGEQLGVTNVVVLRTACRNTGDSYGHISVDLSSGGTGYFACGGKVIDLMWSKQEPDGQLYYTDLEGNPIVFGRGMTYVNIVPLDAQVTFE